MAMTVMTHLSVDFDNEEGVLYVSLGRPQPSHADEAAKGVLLRWANADNHPSGVTAIDFQANWREQRHAFYSIVADHLHLPLGIVESEIERAL
jgi:hypothetical protein